MTAHLSNSGAPFVGTSTGVSGDSINLDIAAPAPSPTSASAKAALFGIGLLALHAPRRKANSLQSDQGAA